MDDGWCKAANLLFRASTLFTASFRGGFPGLSSLWLRLLDACSMAPP